MATQAEINRPYYYSTLASVDAKSVHHQRCVTNYERFRDIEEKYTPYPEDMKLKSKQCVAMRNSICRHYVHLMDKMDRDINVQLKQQQFMTNLVKSIVMSQNNIEAFVCIYNRFDKSLSRCEIKVLFRLFNYIYGTSTRNQSFSLVRLAFHMVLNYGAEQELVARLLARLQIARVFVKCETGYKFNPLTQWVLNAEYDNHNNPLSIREMQKIQSEVWNVHQYATNLRANLKVRDRLLDDGEKVKLEQVMDDLVTLAQVGPMDKMANSIATAVATSLQDGPVFAKAENLIDQMTVLSTKVAPTLDNVAVLSEEVKTHKETLVGATKAFTPMMESVKTTSDAFGKLADRLTGVLDNIRDAYKGIKGGSIAYIMGACEKFVSFILMIFACIMSESRAVIALIIASWCTAMEMTTNLTHFFLGWMTQGLGSTLLNTLAISPVANLDNSIAKTGFIGNKNPQFPNLYGEPEEPNEEGYTIYTRSHFYTLIPQIPADMMQEGETMEEAQTRIFQLDGHGQYDTLTLKAVMHIALEEGIPITEGHAEDGGENVFVGVVKGLAHIFQVREPNEMKVDMQRFKNFRTVRNFGNDLAFIVEVIREGLNYVLDYVMGRPNEKLYEALCKDIEEWTKETLEVAKTDMQLRIQGERAFAIQVKRLYDTGLDLSKRLETIDVGRPLKSSFDSCMTILRSRLDTIHSRARIDRERIRPALVNLWGNPGGGKSSLVKELVQDCFSMRCPGLPYNANDALYSKPAVSEYWSGYCGQFATVYDDAFQLNENLENARIALEIIHAASTETFSLNMAALEDKTGTYFTSELIVFTGNRIGIPYQTQIQSREAFLRRMTACVKVSPKREYTKYENGVAVIDRIRAQGLLTKDVVNLSLCTYYSDTQYTQRQITYEQLLNIIMQDIALNEKHMNSVRSRSEGVKPRYVFQEDTGVVTVGQSDETEVYQPNVHEFWHGKPQPDYKSGVLTHPIPALLGYWVTDLNEDKYTLDARVFGVYTMLNTLYIEDVLCGDIALKPTITQEYSPSPLSNWMMWVAEVGIYLTTQKDPRGSALYKEAVAIASANTTQGITVKTVPGFKEKILALMKKFSEFKDAFAKKVREFTKAHPWVVGALMIVGAIGVGLSIYAITSSGKPSGQAYERKDNKVQYTRVAVRAKPDMHFTRSQMEAFEWTDYAQVGEEYTRCDPNADAFVRNRVLDNIYKINWVTEDGRTVPARVHATVLKDRCLATVTHFHHRRPAGNARLFVTGRKFTGLLDMKNHEYCSVTEDLILIKVPDTKFPLHKDITSNILPEEQMMMDFSEVARVKPTEDEIEIRFSKAQVIPNRSLTYIVGESEPITIPDWMRWYGPNAPGDCGLPYIVYNTSAKGKLVGIHVAGSKASSVIHPLYHVNKIKWDDMPVGQMEVKEESLPKRVQVLRRSDKIAVPSSHSKMVKSRVHESLVELGVKDLLEPAPLRPFVNEQGEWVSPAELNMKKFGDTEPEYSTEQKDLLDECAREAFRHLPMKYPIILPTIEQAINGLEAWPHSQRLVMATSRGWRWKQGYKGEGKWPLFNCGKCGRKKCEDHPKSLEPIKPLAQRLADIMMMVAKGEKIDHTFLTCLKDELVKHEKAKRGKTRIFSTAEVDFVILVRCMYQAFIENMSSDPVEGISAVGINPHSSQWGDLKRRLTRFPDTFINPGDFENFDGRQTHYLAMLSHRLIDRYMMTRPDKEASWNRWIQSCIEYFRKFEVNFDESVLRALREEDFRKAIGEVLYSGEHILFDFIFMVCGANPSGSPLTTVHNVVYNLLIHMYAGVMGCRELGIRGRGGRLFEPQDYFDHFEVSFYGDDHLETTDVEGYTLHMKAKYMAQLGMIYTDPSKGPIDKAPPHIAWKDVTYLKRKFRSTIYGTFAPMDMDMIQQIPMWYAKSGQNDYAVLEQSMESSALEMFHWGEAAYEEWHELLTKACDLASVPRPYVPKYGSIYERWTDDLLTYAQMEDEIYCPLMSGICDKRSSFLAWFHLARIIAEQLEPDPDYYLATDHLSHAQMEEAEAMHFDSIYPPAQLKHARQTGQKYMYVARRVPTEEHEQDCRKVREIMVDKARRINSIQDFQERRRLTIVFIDWMVKVTRTTSPEIQELINFYTSHLWGATKPREGELLPPIKPRFEGTLTFQQAAEILGVTYGQVKEVKPEFRYIKTSEEEISERMVEQFVIDMHMILPMNKKALDFITFGQMDQKPLKEGVTTAFAEDETPPPVPSVRPLKLPFTPFTVEEAGAILRREYLVHQFSVSTSTVRGTLLHTLSWPAELIYIDAIRAVLDYFVYFRAKIVITIRANTTTFHSGKMQISWGPYYNPGLPGIDRMQYMENAFMANTVLLDYQAKERATPEVRIEIPFVTPYSAMNVKQQDYTGTTWNGFMAGMKCYAFSVLQNSQTTSASTASVSVFARFEDIELAGPSYAVIPVTVAQMDTREENLAHKDEAPVVASEKVEKEKKIAGQRLSDLATAASKFVYGWVTVPSLTIPSMIGGTVLGVAGMALRYVGYSKPTNDKIERYITPRAVSNTSFGSGLSNAQKISLSPNHHIGAKWEDFGQRHDYDLIANYVQIPVQVKYALFNTETEVGAALFTSLPVTPNLFVDPQIHALNRSVTPSCVMNIAAFHRYWHGTMKYMLIFDCSMYVSARVRIVWFPYGDATSTAPISGDYYSVTVDIKGTTHYKFSIPFLQNTYALQVGSIYNWDGSYQWGYHNGSIGVYLINEVVTSSPSGDSNIQLSLLGAGDMDMCFSGITNWDYWASSSYSPTVAQMDVREEFETRFPSLLPSSTITYDRVTMGDSTRRWTEFLSRYRLVAATTTSTAPVQDISLFAAIKNPSVNVATALAAGIRAFHYNRGMMRVMVLPSIPIRAALSSRLDNTQLEERNVWDWGSVITTEETNSIAEVELPHYRQTFFRSWDHTSDYDGAIASYQIVAATESTEPILWFASVGEDFLLGCPMSPTPLYLAKDPELKKIEIEQKLTQERKRL